MRRTNKDKLSKIAMHQGRAERFGRVGRHECEITSNCTRNACERTIERFGALGASAALGWDCCLAFGAVSETIASRTTIEQLSYSVRTMIN